MRLNKKGYMLVEIIVSFALTFAIMISMINLVLSFKNKNEDIYYEAKYLKDKNLITRNIMDDLSDDVVTEIHCNATKDDRENIIEQECNLRTIKDYIETVGAMGDEIIIKTSKDNGNTTIEYTFKEKTKDDQGKTIFNDKYYYKKTLEPSLVVGEMYYEDEKGVFKLTIPVNSIYTNESYDINLVTKRVYSLDLNIYVGFPGKYEKYTEGYPTGVNNNEKIKMTVNINEQDITATDIFRFLEYNTLVKFKDIVFPSSLDENNTTNLNVDYKIESDTAINLYYNSNTKTYEEICLVKDTASSLGECETIHKNNI